MKTFANNSFIEAQTTSQSMKTFALFVYYYTYIYMFCKYYFSKNLRSYSLYSLTLYGMRTTLISNIKIIQKAIVCNIFLFKELVKENILYD